MESENNRKREPLPGGIFDDFGAIRDPPKRSKIDQNGRGTLIHSVLVMVCVGFLDLDPILIDFDLIWTPSWTHFGSILDQILTYGAKGPAECAQRLNKQSNAWRVCILCILSVGRTLT